MTDKKTENKEEDKMVSVLEGFWDKMETIGKIDTRLQEVLREDLKKTRENFQKYIKKNKKKGVILDRKVGKVRFPIEHGKNIKRLLFDEKTSMVAEESVPSFLLVQITSIFEKFLVDIAYEAIKRNEDLRKNILQDKPNIKHPQNLQNELENIVNNQKINDEDRGRLLRELTEKNQKEQIDGIIQEGLREGNRSGKLKFLKKDLDIEGFMNTEDELEFGFQYELRNCMVHNNGIATNILKEYIKKRENLYERRIRLKKAELSLKDDNPYNCHKEIARSYSFFLYLGLRIGDLIIKNHTDVNEEDIFKYYNHLSLRLYDEKYSHEYSSRPIHYGIKLYEEGYQFRMKSKELKYYFYVNACLGKKMLIKRMTAYFKIINQMAKDDPMLLYIIHYRSFDYLLTNKEKNDIKKLRYARRGKKKQSKTQRDQPFVVFAKKVIKMCNEKLKTYKDKNDENITKINEIPTGPGGKSFDESRFLIAKYLLLDEYKLVSELLISITDSQLGINQILGWPLAESYIGEKIFRDTYKTITGEEYEPPPLDFEDESTS